MADHFLFVDQQFEFLTIRSARRWNWMLIARALTDRIHLLRRAPQSRAWQVSYYKDDLRDFAPFIGLTRQQALGAVARIVYAGERSAGASHINECIQWWAWNRFLWTISHSLDTRAPIVFVVEGSSPQATYSALEGAIVTSLARSDEILSSLGRVTASWQLKAVVIEYVSSTDKTHDHQLLEWLQSDHNIFARLEAVTDSIDKAPIRTGAASRPRLENIHTHDTETLRRRLNDGRFYVLYRIKKADADGARLNDSPFGLTPETLVFDGITVAFWRCPPEARAVPRRPELESMKLDFRSKGDGR